MTFYLEIIVQTILEQETTWEIKAFDFNPKHPSTEHYTVESKEW